MAHMGTTRGLWASLSTPKHGMIMYPDCGTKVVVVWATEAGLIVSFCGLAVYKLANIPRKTCVYKYMVGCRNSGLFSIPGTIWPRIFRVPKSGTSPRQPPMSIHKLAQISNKLPAHTSVRHLHLQEPHPYPGCSWLMDPNRVDWPCQNSFRSSNEVNLRPASACKLRKFVQYTYKEL